jgi:hypothetical protein
MRSISLFIRSVAKSLFLVSSLSILLKVQPMRTLLQSKAHQVRLLPRLVPELPQPQEMLVPVVRFSSRNVLLATLLAVRL